MNLFIFVMGAIVIVKVGIFLYLLNKSFSKDYKKTVSVTNSHPVTY